MLLNPRNFVDKHVPWLARNYRRLRDWAASSQRKFMRTSLGFYFIGAESMETSRSAAGETEIVISRLREADVFIDGGANTGFFSMLACQQNVRTLAYEPNSANFSLLLRNIEKNAFKNIVASQIALGSGPAIMKLYGGGQGASLRPNWGGMASTYSTEVKVDSLDNLIAKRFPKERLFIKIDVEGHELEVLKGAAVLLSRTPRPVWLVEHGFTENFSGSINPNFAQLFQLFWSLGYTARTADLERRIVHPADVNRWLASGVRDFGYVNYLFTSE